MEEWQLSQLIPTNYDHINFSCNWLQFITINTNNNHNHLQLVVTPIAVATSCSHTSSQQQNARYNMETPKSR